MVTDRKCLMQTDSVTHSHTPNLEMLLLSHLKNEIMLIRFDRETGLITFVFFCTSIVCGLSPSNIKSLEKREENFDSKSKSLLLVLLL